MSVCCECCVLSGSGLGDELITRPEESYLLWCVVVCDLETPWMRRPWPALGRSATRRRRRRRRRKNIYIYTHTQIWLIGYSLGDCKMVCLKSAGIHVHKN